MKKLLAISVLGLTFVGCASIPPAPQSLRVIATPTPPPRGCQYLGQVVGNQGNFFTGGFTSNRNLEEGAMNDLKNKAAQLGANYIQLIINRAGITGSMNGGFDHQGGYVGGGSQQTNVTNMGNAYRCPAKAIGL